MRHLIHHTSGLRDQWNLLALAGWRLDDVITRDQILRLITRQRELNFEPGAEYLYCNTGYTLLAEIVSRVTGQPFPEWTRENLFEPLGMTRTHFHDDHQEIVPGRAYSYEHDPEGGYRKSVLSYANAGATSLFTTAPDLVRWMRNLDTGGVGGSQVLETVHTRGVLNDGDTIPYAFGLVHGAFLGLATVGHGGADAGFRSNVLRFPEQGLSVVVLSNLAGFNPGGLARGAAEVFLGEMDVLPEAPAEGGERTDPATGETVSVDPEILRDYVGSYRVGGIVVEISVDDGRLIATAQDDALELQARSETEFRSPPQDVTIVFVRDQTGEVTHFLLRQGGQETEAPRIPPFDAASVELAAYVGTYDSPELETTYELVVEDSALVARHVRHDAIALTPVEEDVFSGSAWFFGETRFERGPGGEITGMRVSSGRVRDLLFVKRAEGSVRR